MPKSVLLQVIDGARFPSGECHAPASWHFTSYGDNEETGKDDAKGNDEKGNNSPGDDNVMKDESAEGTIKFAKHMALIAQLRADRLAARAKIAKEQLFDTSASSETSYFTELVAELPRAVESVNPPLKGLKHDIHELRQFREQNLLMQDPVVERSLVEKAQNHAEAADAQIQSLQGFAQRMNLHLSVAKSTYDLSRPKLKITDVVDKMPDREEGKEGKEEEGHGEEGKDEGKEPDPAEDMKKCETPAGDIPEGKTSAGCECMPGPERDFKKHVEEEVEPESVSEEHLKKRFEEETKNAPPMPKLPKNRMQALLMVPEVQQKVDEVVEEVGDFPGKNMLVNFVKNNPIFALNLFKMAKPQDAKMLMDEIKEFEKQPAVKQQVDDLMAQAQKAKEERRAARRGRRARRNGNHGEDENTEDKEDEEEKKEEEEAEETPGHCGRQGQAFTWCQVKPDAKCPLFKTTNVHGESTNPTDAYGVSHWLYKAQSSWPPSGLPPASTGNRWDYCVPQWKLERMSPGTVHGGKCSWRGDVLAEYQFDSAYLKPDGTIDLKRVPKKDRLAVAIMEAYEANPDKGICDKVQGSGEHAVCPVEPDDHCPAPGSWLHHHTWDFCADKGWNPKKAAIEAETKAKEAEAAEAQAKEAKQQAKEAEAAQKDKEKEAKKDQEDQEEAETKKEETEESVQQSSLASSLTVFLPDLLDRRRRQLYAEFLSLPS